MGKEFKIKLVDLKNEGTNFFKEVVQTLDSKQINFWIEYGSLLGAIRSGETIPWDSEFDLGTFESQDDLKKIFDNKKYLVSMEPNRLKLRPRDKNIGFFSIDIHLHELNGKYTKLLFGSKVVNNYKILNKVKELISSVFKKDSFNIRYSTIVRELAKYYELNNTLFEKELIIINGKFNHEKSFMIKVDDKIYPDVFLSNIKWYRRYFLLFLYYLPNWIIRLIFILLKSILPEERYENKFQTIPVEIYQKFRKIKFCGIELNAPKRSEDFLLLVYGSNWRTPNMNFSRSEMKNITND